MCRDRLSYETAVIAYISRTLTKAIKNYCITEKGVIAALCKIEKLRFSREGTYLR